MSAMNEIQACDIQWVRLLNGTRQKKKREIWCFRMSSIFVANF